MTFQNDQISLEQEQNILFLILSAHKDIQQKNPKPFPFTDPFKFSLTL